MGKPDIESDREAGRDCNCVTRQGVSGAVEERYIGTDRTNGRFADVTVNRCAACGRLWLRYQVEYEHTSRSGRWAEGIVDEAAATRITPEKAAQVLSSLPWQIYGGSLFGHVREETGGTTPPPAHFRQDHHATPAPPRCSPP